MSEKKRGVREPGKLEFYFIGFRKNKNCDFWLRNTARPLRHPRGNLRNKHCALASIGRIKDSINSIQTLRPNKRIRKDKKLFEGIHRQYNLLNHRKEPSSYFQKDFKIVMRDSTSSLSTEGKHTVVFPWILLLGVGTNILL